MNRDTIQMEQKEKRTVGQLLRAAREAKGISREEAATATRIKSVFLGAMEDDDYHLLPMNATSSAFWGNTPHFSN